MEKSKRKSWVWQDAVREGDKAYFLLCSEVDDISFTASGRSKVSIGNHRKNIRGKT
jgi:hypothetical protein